MTPEELKRLEELEKRMDAAAVKFKQIARLQSTMDEILASQKDLREKIERAELGYSDAKGHVALRYHAIRDLYQYFLDKLKKEIDELSSQEKKG